MRYEGRGNQVRKRRKYNSYEEVYFVSGDVFGDGMWYM